MSRMKTIVFLSLALIPVQFATGSVRACGWSGDGEMILRNNQDVFFVPRGIDSMSDPNEMARISAAYRTGTGAEKDSILAMTWARRAAAAGHAGAMNNLGYMYESGFAEGVNETAAVFWYERAADLGIAAAQHSLSLMLRVGRGVDSDIPAADMWLRRAAENGHSSAASEIATLIWRDEISATFPDEGCFWWLVAIEGGLEVSSDRCQIQSPNLAESRFAELLEMVDDWVASSNSQSQQ